MKIGRMAAQSVWLVLAGLTCFGANACVEADVASDGRKRDPEGRAAAWDAPPGSQPPSPGKESPELAELKQAGLMPPAKKRTVNRLREPGQGKRGVLVDETAFVLNWDMAYAGDATEKDIETPLPWTEPDAVRPDTFLSAENWFQRDFFGQTKRNGIVSFSAVFSGQELPERAYFYFVTDLEVPQTIMRPKLFAGANGDVKIWIDGRRVLVKRGGKEESLRIDADPVELPSMEKGTRRIVVKFMDRSIPEKGEERLFFLRFTDENECPLPTRTDPNRDGERESEP